MFAELKPYAAYAESGISWLGRRPEGWELIPGGAALALVKAKNRDLSEPNVLSLSYGRIVVKPTDRLHGLVPDSFASYQILEPGAIVVRPTDLQNDKTSARVGLARDRGIITSAYLAFNVRSPLSPEFTFRYLATLDSMKIFYGLGSGLRQNLGFSDFKRLPLLAPPPEEQAAIVRYLAHANARIDRAIMAKRRLISLLEEQKQVVINQAITRGLDPTTPTRDSGVPWLGAIPEHWAVVPVGSAARLIQTGPFGSQLHAAEYVEGGFPVVNPSHILAGGITPDPGVAVGEVKAEALTRHRFIEGDVVAARRGELGRSAVVTAAEAGWICGTGSLLIRLHRHMFTPDFFQLVFSSRQSREQLEAGSVGATMANLNAKIVARLRVLSPPMSEQRQITNHVAREAATVDTAISRSRREIELLREFRTRLTADVVTGQVDVREIASRLADIDPAEAAGGGDLEDEGDFDAEAEEYLDEMTVS